MADNANPCPNCGAERPANVPEAFCSRCLTLQAAGAETPNPDGVVTIAATGIPAENPEVVPATSIAGTTDATGNRTPDAETPRQKAAGLAASRDLTRRTLIRYFGDYEVQEELGRGGMGVVYKARQLSLNRPVALKVIKAGVLADAADLRRFKNEAEAVALLDHPGIVPVYEVGEHDGQRYFSMKLVEGSNLAERLNSFKDYPKAAATLLAESAEAVHHAHMRGILHRDLKPANVLVDAEGRPHVTDFGLAKRVEADIEMTVSGAILGTPAYMSPEQAVGHRGTITTATDIYGLGAILYALLTGKSPFSGDSVMETLDAVRNQPPEPPTKLNVHTPRDLETICLKCLEKDPRRRYSSAQALADDFRAWLDSRPISARRVGAAERSWLWCKRNPAVAALAASVVIAIVGGSIASTALWLRAERNYRNEQAARQDAQARYLLAMDAIKTFHTGVSEDFLLTQDQFKELRNRLLRSAADFYGRLSVLLKERSDLASRRVLAQSNFELADLTGKVGSHEDALTTHRAVLAAREALAAEPGADIGDKIEVGRSLTAIAGLLDTLGKTDDAVAAYRRSEALLAVLEPKGAASMTRAALAESRSSLGWLLTNARQYREALVAYRLVRSDQQALTKTAGATRAHLRDLADTTNRIGLLMLREGQMSEAETNIRVALGIRERLSQENPTDSEFRRRMAESHFNLAMVTRDSNERNAELRKALAATQRLVDDNPAVTILNSHLANIHGVIGYGLLQTGRADEALDSFGQEEALLKSLVTAHPSSPDHRSCMANCQNNISTVFIRTGRTAEARSRCERALALGEVLVRDNPNVPNYHRNLAESLLRFGQVRRLEGDLVGATADWRRAIAMYDALPSLTGEECFLLACCHASLSGLAEQAGAGLSAAQRDAEADRAMALLKKQGTEIFRTETALDPLRNRPDFQLLVLDLAFPDDVFSR